MTLTLNRPVTSVDLSGFAPEDILHPGEYIQKEVCVILCKTTTYGISLTGVSYSKSGYDLGLGIAWGYKLRQSTEEPSNGKSFQVGPDIDLAVGSIAIQAKDPLSLRKVDLDFEYATPLGIASLEASVRGESATGIGFLLGITGSIGKIEKTTIIHQAVNTPIIPETVEIGSYQTQFFKK